MNHIVQMYKNFLVQSGEKERGLKVQNIKQRLESHFGDKLCFLAPKGKTEIVYSEKTLCKERLLYDVVTSNVISDSAEIIRNEILSFKNPSP